MTCPNCHGSGLIPFVKDGKVIPHAFVDCECKEESPAEYHQLQPDDFDFPVSRDFFRFYASKYHWPDPGNMIEQPITEKIKPMQHINQIINYNFPAKPITKQPQKKGVEL